MRQISILIFILFFAQSERMVPASGDGGNSYSTKQSMRYSYTNSNPSILSGIGTSWFARSPTPSWKSWPIPQHHTTPSEGSVRSVFRLTSLPAVSARLWWPPQDTELIAYLESLVITDGFVIESTSTPWPSSPWLHDPHENKRPWSVNQIGN